MILLGCKNLFNIIKIIFTYVFGDQRSLIIGTK